MGHGDCVKNLCKIVEVNCIRMSAAEYGRRPEFQGRGLFEKKKRGLFGGKNGQMGQMGGPAVQKKIEAVTTARPSTNL